MKKGQNNYFDRSICTGHISEYVIPILLGIRWMGCFLEMAVLSGMICFRRSDAPTDRFPNNNHIAMNIRPGRWHVDQMSVTLLTMVVMFRIQRDQ